MKKIGRVEDDGSIRVYAWVYEALKGIQTPPEPPPPTPDPDEGDRALESATVAGNSDRGIHGWPVTATLVEVLVFPGLIDFPCYQDPTWPEYQTGTGSIPIVGNVWFMAKLAGQWHAGTVDWLKPRQHSKTLDVPEEHVDTAHALPTFIKEGPLGSYVPTEGDECGLFVSSVARNGHQTVNERSNVILFSWTY